MGWTSCPPIAKGGQDVHPTGFFGSPNKALRMLGFVPQTPLATLRER
ncbi:hypothetical protein IQ274_12795 [Nostoc sp. LEGE 12447]|nr:hypothetical protein [Nostoc sp. LEGE 12447]MBE8999065.1 hypothetical protein [Nostoc sp. LEGE 12447]